MRHPPVEPLARARDLVFGRLPSGYAWQDERGRTLAFGLNATEVFALAADMRLTGRKAVAALTFRRHKAGARLPASARPHSCGHSERHVADLSGMRVLGTIIRHETLPLRMSRRERRSRYLYERRPM